MPTLLPLRPPLIHRETAPSFLSRMAAANGVNSVDFAVDMGFCLRRIIDMEEIAVERLGDLGGLDDRQREALRGWTGERSGNVRMTFRGETFVSRALRNPKVRGCPVCLREDAETNGGAVAAVETMAMRGDWQLREVSLCVRHRHPLVQLWERNTPNERFNIAERLSEIMEAIRTGQLDLPRVEPSSYDLWLNERLESGRDTTWLASQSLYAATTFVRLLGTELLRHNGLASIAEGNSIGHAQAAGLAVASRGEDAIRDALDGLAARATGSGDKPLKAFGPLYTKLSKHYLHEQCFDTFRHLLRECIIAIWPIAAGEDILGLPLPERRIHSLNSAAHETDIDPSVLEKFLVNAGAIPVDDDRPLNRKTFDAKAHAALLKEIPTLVGPMEMRQTMGATLPQFNSLVADGLLIPRIDVPKINSPWRLSDGIDLVTELETHATEIVALSPEWEEIQKAKIRSGLSVGVIIAAIRSGLLCVGQRDNIGGYRGLLVRRDDINRIAEEYFDSHPDERRFPPDNAVTTAVFGRAVGLRDTGRFLALVSAGHTPATRMKHPTPGVETFYMSAADVATFHRKFVTSTTMAAESGEHYFTLLSRLRAAGVGPFAPSGEDYGSLYLRDEVEAVLDLRGSRRIPQT